jgi:propanediol utilization protein
MTTVETVINQPTMKLNGATPERGAYFPGSAAPAGGYAVTRNGGTNGRCPSTTTWNWKCPLAFPCATLHLCPEHVEILFGKGHDLTVYNELYQKGYYAAREQVMVVGRKRAIEKVRVLGPTRPYSQVELAQTDALIIGMKLPIATDGADPACQPITLVGPEGAVTLPGNGGGGAFIARRHIHISDKTAVSLGVKHGDLLDCTSKARAPRRCTASWCASRPAGAPKSTWTPTKATPSASAAAKPAR